INAAFQLSQSAKQHVLKHNWPGNVRELEQVILRAAVLAQTNEIQAEDLELGSNLEGRSRLSAEFSHCDDFRSLKEAQREFTRHYIGEVIEKFSGNKTQAAAYLGVSERTLYRFCMESGPARGGM
ncbi:MAG: hypothetical protein HY537_03415, partial [Deltaproteobacteria bacterium]|nr:hypothetical protein [Deltaproteobacteria bacterium]